MVEEKIYEIPLKDIQVAETNVRHTEVDKDLDELAASIKKHGLLQPVLLLGEYGEPPYKVIVGQRRFLAHQKLKKAAIKATFAGEMNALEASIRSLAENMCRVELNHADAAEAVTNLFKKFDRDAHKVAAETGLSLPKVRQYIHIQERASQKMKDDLRARKVHPQDIQRALKASGEDVKKAERLLEKMQDLTGYQKKRIVEIGENNPKATVDKILEEAKKPRVERQILIKLSESARLGLEKAAKQLAMDPDEVAAQALEEWLSKKGFIG